MALWLFKATATKASLECTTNLAEFDHFLCKADNDLKKKGTMTQRAINVDQVQVGDVLHCYYILKSVPYWNSAYEVIKSEKHPHPEWFGEPVEGTALYTLADDAFLKRRDREGAYDVDPVAGAYTGWPLVRVGKAMKYDGKRFPGQATLVRYEEPATTSV